MTDPLRDAYSTVPRQPAERAAIDRTLRADSWRYNPQLESLREQVESGELVPSASQRMSLAYYATDKAAAVAEGHDTSGEAA